jgi:hypothetical protein
VLCRFARRRGHLIGVRCGKMSNDNARTEKRIMWNVDEEVN